MGSYKEPDSGTLAAEPVNLTVFFQSVEDLARAAVSIIDTISAIARTIKSMDEDGSLAKLMELAEQSQQ